MSNPFAGYGRIVSGERLVGRDVLVERLVDRLATSLGSHSIVGEPRIGKSSVVGEVIGRVKDLRREIPVVEYVVSTTREPIAMFNHIIDSAVQQLRRKRVPLPEDIESTLGMPTTSLYEAFSRCRDGFEALCEEGVRTLLVVEEFDAVRKFENSADAISCLRELLYKPNKYGLSGVIESRRSLRSIEKQVRDVSILDGICEKEYLRPFDSDGITAMIARCGEQWSPSAPEVELLIEYSGGHPWIAEMILCRAWDVRSMQAGIEASVSEIYEHYEQLRDILSEDNMFQQLTQVAVGPHWSIKPGATEWLSRYGIVVKNEEQESYRGWSVHFQSYLERCTRETPAWALWGNAESALRSLIEDKCISQHGDDWLVKLSKKHKSIADIEKGCLERRDKERQRFGPSASDRLLDYTYPMDLWTIISAEWSGLFQKTFKPGKPYWRERFELLAKVRTPAAHNRPIPESDVSTANGYCQELLELLRHTDDPK